MNIGHIFNLILIYPLLNLLVFFYHYIPDIGVVIILLTVLIRLLLFPSFHKQLKAQKAMNEIAPKMNAVKEKFKDDKEAQAKAMMELYKEHEVNPFGSCLPLLIQLPILIALYQVFIRSLNGSHLVGLYSFIHDPGKINPIFLHFLNLAHFSIPLALLAGILQYFQGRIMLPKAVTNDPNVKIMQWQTLYLLPSVTMLLGVRLSLGPIHVGLGLPAGLILYWIITTLFNIGQQYYILGKEEKVVEGAIDAAK